MNECTIIFNTTYGYCMKPQKCRSISEALRLAKNNGMAYRIFGKDGKFIKSGWYRP